MKTVTFTADYNHRTRTGHIAYRAGETFEVSDEVAEVAGAAGVIKPTEAAPARKP